MHPGSGGCPTVRPSCASDSDSSSPPTRDTDSWPRPCSLSFLPFASPLTVRSRGPPGRRDSDQHVHSKRFHNPAPPVRIVFLIALPINPAGSSAGSERWLLMHMHIRAALLSRSYRLTGECYCFACNRGTVCFSCSRSLEVCMTQSLHPTLLRFRQRRSGDKYDGEY
ncbi:hypothetical protein BD309DRAFT_957319 [Dichomitus squalens]|uniref:Uncharacterized protein n=1 Tax=Dichomitus squalens TaxID=114155 RepID=A0A4Q9NTG2_9APHY|nr:hypothetical protein BD309DRAFT_957319 [Dichomitus squalens]TBU56484.1 hypothetical protein BD310DRAFT_609119 [Dichomitus squalens]